MNLELIKKYEKEFLHMLHGGTLLFHSSYHGGWHTLPGDYQWDDDYGFVINDKYIEFRKALAEGKKIQFFNTKERLYNSSKPLHTWQDIDTIRTHGIPSDYRIKPEEPKFKVGDWITVKGPTGTFTEQISSINDDTYTLSGTNICYKSQATKWEPKKGEVCIFWSDGTYSAVIGIFSNMNQEKYVTITTQIRSNCMPFTGVLPPHMKESL